MTPVDEQPNDTKLLLAVAGLVIVGAAGIALIAGLGLQDGATADGSHGAPVFESSTGADLPAGPARPLPAEATATAANFPAAAVESEDVTPEVPAAEQEPRFEIDPDEDFVTRGVELYGAREFAHAAAYFQAEIDARPQRAWTHYMLGLSLWKSGSAGEAEAALEAAGKLDPTSIKTFVNLARIRNDLGDPEGALEASEVALGIDAEDAAARFLEGRSLMKLGRLDEAVESLRASVEREGDNGYARNMLGLTLLRRGDPVEAAAELERAAELEPDVAFVRNNLGMALELSGRTEEAVAAYRAGVAIDPAHEKVAANLARLEPLAAPTVAGSLAAEPIETTGPVVSRQAGADGTESTSGGEIEVAVADGDRTP